MFSTAEKTTPSAAAVQQKTAGATFFRKAGEDSFFDAKESPSFFSAAVQPKLSVSSPDDPQEKEADEVADKVMRMPEPVSASAEEKEKEKVQAKEEEGIEQSGALFVNSTDLKPEKKEKVQAKLFTLHRMEEPADESDFSSIDAGSDFTINRKNTSLYPSDVLRQSGRGPPAGSIPFEQTLTTSRGTGSLLPADTRQYMESRFQADFSQVRIHTGATAEALSSNIHAQAFTHGSDIYFNAGKFAPHTAQGSLLLAHELTHTIQQGAVQSPASLTTSAVARKLSIQRSPDGSVPSQLTNAIAKAKTQEGKINANKEGPDGNRTGWENLLDIFKTTFGEDKIISGSGGSVVPGAISEANIKKKRIQKNTLIVDPVNTSGTKMGERDAMPSWCGILVFWALNKSGVPMPKWQLGRNVIKPEAAYPPGHIPRPGDIAYRRAYSHFALVENASGSTVRTVNGNTAGEDNLGGQVQSREHAINDWTGFFNPLLIMEGNLGSGEGAAPENPKTLSELRKELFDVNRKEKEEDPQSERQGEENLIQSKQEVSDWSVQESGQLSRTTENNIQAKEEEKKEEKEKLSDNQPAAIQKKEFERRHCEDVCAEKPAITSHNEFSVSPQTEYNNSSLNHYQDEVTASIGNEHERGPPVQAKSQPDSAVIQRSVIDDALSYVSTSSILGCVEITDFDATQACVLRKAQEVALHIPGYRALRVVLGEDPITGQHIERNGRNFIEAAFDIMPGGRLLHQKLDEQHQLDAAAAWMDEQIDRIENLVDGLLGEFAAFWNRLGITDLTSPLDVLREGAGIVLRFIDDVIDFAVEAATELLERVKEYLLAKIVDFIKEQTPAYPLLTVILGKDPITEQEVERNGTNILNALLELGGEEGRMQRQQMQETGTFQRVAGYIDEGIAVFGGAYDQIIQGFHNIWNHVSIESLMDPVETFRQVYNEFAEPVRRVWNFVSEVAAAILQFIKEILMRRLSAWARTVRGYYLVTVIIGKDPFTDEVVPRNVENIIHGFMSLMEGGEEQFNQMKESGAIAQTTQRINAAVARLNMTPAYIVQLFIDLWNSFSLQDLANPIAAFQRIIDRFGEPIGRLIAFVVEIVKIVIEVILRLMNFPIDLISNIISKAMQAFDRIKRDPVGFLKNLLRAIKQGFIQFFDNILQHLLQGLVGWLMSEMRDAGMPELQDLSLRGIISWVLQVLGISMEKIWEKLAQHPRIGPERVQRIRGLINTLEGIWTFIKDVQERGIAAIWDKIQEQLSNLWNIVLDAVKNWIMEKIITQVTVKLLSMLDPTGIMAVINSAIALYNAVQSFIKYLREMLQIVNSFVEGVAEIASGNITRAANFLERTLGSAVPIVIGFLANQVGLSGIGRRIGEMIERARELVDQALTWLVNKAVDTGMALLDRVLSMGRAAAGAVLGWLGLRKSYTSNTGASHQMYFRGTGAAATLMVESTPTPVDTFLTAKLSEVNASTTTDETAKQQIRDKVALARQKNTELNALINPPGGAAAPNNDTAINQKMEEIKNILKDLDISGGSQVVPRAVYLPGFNSSKATIMDVKYVFNDPANHDPGQAANDYNGTLSGALPLLESVGLRSIWVAYHVVNADLGGKAVDSNLIPTPRLINGEYYRAFESPLKTIYRSNKPIWMMAIVNYRSDYPDFPSEFQATGGGMKFENNTWVPDPANNVPSFARSIDAPVPESVYINQLPANENDWYLIINLTPLSRPVLRIVKDKKGSTVIASKNQIKGLIDTHGASYGYQEGFRTNMKNRVDEASINFSP